MAPTPQQNTESTSLYNSSSTSSVNTTSSSKSHSTSKTASSYINGSNSNRLCNNRATVENRLAEMETLLPISSRGLFHDDSFFEDARKQFHEAVKDVLVQWNLKSGHLEDNLTTYRELRECDLRDDNQAVSVTQDDICHKVILDVRDFMKSDVKVKMVDENELVVEGTVEKEDNGCVSKKSFRRSFVFPGLIKSQDVSLAMSSDGVLTVTVPKNNQSKVSQIQVKSDTKRSSNVQNLLSTNTSLGNTAQEDMENNVESHFLLPVTKKGHFFQDSFFESARKDFENAVEQVLNNWGESETDFDKMTNYRSLREHNLKEENQAISVTEHKDHHKVILDVKDFMDRDVKVKMVDENELKIEGSTEFKKDGTTSRKSFSRSFVFPGLIKSDAVTSAMSSDGILTVTVPKTSTNNTQQSTKSSSTIHSEIKESAKVNKSNLTSRNTSENTTKEENSRALQTNLDSLLPVCHRGLFFHDNFFESARKEYEKAVQEVLGKFGNTTSLTDSMSSYRTLRNTNLMDENQALSVTEDHQSHKVVMDVRDFMHNDLKVKVVDENELVVEGTFEKKEEESVSKKSFCRSFVFPGLVNSDAVSSALSSDGVLTITVPKASRPETSVKTVRFSTDDGTSASGSSQKVSSTEHNQRSSLNSSQESKINKSHAQKSEFDRSSTSNTLNTFEDENRKLINQTDSFSNDDFFQTARQDFESTLKKISHEWDSDFSSDFMDTHESLHETNKDESLAVSMTDDNTTHKIVVHVGDFVKEGIQVKLVDNNEVLLVEALMDKQEAGKTSSKTFSRRIQLPGAVHAVTSTLSKDGILTITAQKNSQKILQ